MVERDRQMTVPEFVARKKGGQKISVLTAYDFAFARLIDEAGVDCILVGDSLSMVVQGNSTTLPVTLDEMIYHAEMVGRAVKRALVIVDLPFPTNHLGVHRTIEMAGRILKETRCQAVKLEGGKDQAEVISGLVSAGIPVMAHVGLRPQSVHTMGGYKVQRDEPRLLEDAKAAEAAGAFGLLLECIPGPLSQRITASLSIPTIGIGAGPHCDGQVLVLHDMLGLTTGYTPKFVRRYADLGKEVKEAAAQYCRDVARGEFPSASEQYA
jgi:3-methyl-2-oxobutanoate hydroxymethyltransferase